MAMIARSVHLGNALVNNHCSWKKGSILSLANVTFLHFYWNKLFVLVKEYELSSSAVKDCTFISKHPVDSDEECKYAASIFGLTFEGRYFEAASFPKGCFSNTKSIFPKGVYWNVHETGSEQIDSFPICEKRGECTVTYRFKVYSND